MKIEKHIARVECGNENESGTGFLIQDKLVLTALHTVSEYTSDSSISITFPYSDFSKEEVYAKVIDYDEDLDIALLELDIEFKYDVYLNINVSKIAENETWQTFGFPISKWTPGSRLTGYILRSDIENEQLLWDTDLFCDQKLERFDGFSGSPLVIEGCIKGIILQELDGTIAAISSLKIRSFLDKNSIIYENSSDISILNLETNEENTELPINKAVVLELENKISEQEKGYILLKGSPGSGKSTLITEYTPKNQEIKVIGKYLVRNRQDGLPVTFKASDSVFAEWLEKALWRELYTDMPPKRERKLHEWILDIQKLFTLLSEKLMLNGTKGILFIDGIEDVYYLNKIQDFFSLLPEDLPNNILVVIACQNEGFLPISYKARIEESSIVKLAPLSLKDTRYVVYSRLYDEKLSVKVKEAIVIKSEGHPLYLRYLIEECIQLKDENIVSNWLNEVPSIGGDIKVYYESLWQREQENPNEFYILSTIARLREGIDVDTLREVLPSNIRNMLMVFLPKINHLLDTEECITIYHSSFANFIVDKTNIISEEIHNQIVKFCKGHDNHLYSIKNILFHMLRQTESLRTEVITYCNQTWIDKCTTYHIEPDLILSDLNEVMDYALGIKIKIKESIRLLLLSQRIKFRYNNLFAKSAAEIANLLIQKKQLNEAMKYIVRHGFLIIPDDNAIDFLNKFLQNQAYKEAQVIFDILKHRLTLAMESGQISYKIIKSYFNALSMMISYRSDDPEYEFFRQYRILVSQLKYIPDEEKENYMELCLWIVSYHRAFLIFNRDEYRPIELYEEQGLPIDSKMLRILSFILMDLSEFKKTYGIKNNLNGKLKLIEDIKYIYRKIEVDKSDNEAILMALVGNRFEIDIIESLIKNSNTNNIPLLIRAENGVDLNYNSIYEFNSFWLYQGFIKGEDKYPEIINSNRATWEDYLKNIISFLGFIKGRAWRLRCEERDTDLGELADKLLNNLLPMLNLQLKERASWDRSYFLPEDAFVFIYKEIAEFYHEYCPSRVQDFLNFLKENLDTQLGIYTEGFRETIFTVINILKGIPGTKKNIYNLSKGLEHHILVGVQNRWERTENLISLATIYAYLENEGSTDRIIQELLNTSMGPSWYKESQLSLINSSLVNLQHSKEIKSYLADLASILEHASGEMTFQRYVRVEKEEFIGSLCRIGYLDNAIKFLKEDVLPSPKVLQEKLEPPQIDYVERGKGYKFGIGNLEEQNVILEILENTEGIHPVLKWAFCELFLIGDIRYLDRFASIMAKLISDSDGSSRRQLFFERLLKIFISDMTQNERDQYLIFIKSALPHQTFNDFRELIVKSNIQIENKDIVGAEDIRVQKSIKEAQEKKEEREELFLPGTFGKNDSINDAHQLFLEATDEMEMDNYKAAKLKFVEGLKKLQKGGWQIWSGTISTEMNQAFNNLANICEDQELVILLKSLIVDEEYAQDWQIVNKILDLIGNRFTETDATEILKVIIEHLNLMVRPPQELKEYYNWLNNKESSHPTNIKLFQLFIWYLNSPNNLIQHRGPEILKGLTRIDPNFFIPVILDYCFDIDSARASEICAGIVYSIALEDINLVWPYINQEYIMDRIQGCEHFTIKYILIKILKMGGVDMTITENSSVCSNMNHNINFNEEYWRSLHPLFKSLENVNCWDKADYIELQKYILENNPGLDIEDLSRIDSYLALAYRKQNESDLLHSEIYRAVNKLLVSRVYDTDALKIFKVLNRVNLIFPSEQIRLNSKPSLQKAIEEFIFEGSNPEIFLTDEEYEHLHYIEVIYSQQKNLMEFIEITAFITNQEDILNDEFDLNQIAIEFSPNELPDFTSEKAELGYKPLIYKAKLDNNYYGGTFTPSYLNQNLDILGDNDKKDAIRESWIEERSWEFGKTGMPLREGSRLLLSKERINSLKEKGWRVIWFVDYNHEKAVIIDREKRQIIHLW
ncbi:serine protease [Priestia megaterium]|uniref:serine protease n=1 Tax=Priestia megaterium TaxID=1404 RepID=UPI00188EF28E|nr:serine protease [Priestia megaterium]